MSEAQVIEPTRRATLLTAILPLLLLLLAVVGILRELRRAVEPDGHIPVPYRVSLGILGVLSVSIPVTALLAMSRANRIVLTSAGIARSGRFVPWSAVREVVWRSVRGSNRLRLQLTSEPPLVLVPGLYMNGEERLLAALEQHLPASLLAAARAQLASAE